MGMAVDFRGLVETAPDVVALVDGDGRYQYANAAVETAFGVSPAELIGKTNEERMPASHATAWRLAVAEVLATGEPQRIECNLETRHGLRTFSSHLSRVGELVSVVSRDVTAPSHDARFLADASAVLERFDDRTRRLQELSTALSRTDEPTRVIETLVDAGRAAAGATAGFAWMLRNPDTLQLVAVAEYDSTAPTITRYETIPMSAALPACDAIRSSEPILFESYEQLVAAYPSSATLTRYKAWAIIPIATGDRSVGVVTFAFSMERTFQLEDRDLLVAMSRQASLALERCRLLDAERRARADAEASRLRERQLHMLAARLSSALTRDEIAAAVCDEARSALGLHVVGAAVRVSPTTIVAIGTGGGRQPRRHRVELPIEESTPTTDAIRTGDVVWCSTRDQLDARYPARKHIWEAQGLGSGGAVPFAFEDRTIGALLLGFDEARDLTTSERDLLGAMGQLTGQALERARLGEAQMQSDERLRDALIAARAATWAVRIDTMSALRDASYRRLVGSESTSAPADFSSIHPDDRDIARAAFERSLADGSPYEPLVRLRRDDGSYRWYQAHGRLAYDDAGKPATMQGVVVDVDEAHRAKLRAEQERRVTDTMHRIASTFTSELDHDKLVERIVEELRTAIGAENGAFCVGAESADLPHAPSNLEVPIIGKDGHTFGHLHFRHHTPGIFTDEHERLVASIAPQAAIALENARLYNALRERGEELERAVERARHADRRKDEFLAMLGHELRNPLAPIMTALELIELKRIDGLTKEREVLRRQVNHLARLIDDLLDVSRVTRGKINLEKQTIDLSSVLGKAVEMASPLLDKRRQHLEIATMPGGALIDADPTRLAQVFQNLLTNAAKYSDTGSQISIRTLVTDDEVIVTVRDNGIGIPVELLPHMFEPFVQGERTLDRSDGGLGIGLTIARSLTELHGGRIAVSSDGPGTGSAFTVTLPRSHRPRISTEDMRPLRSRTTEGAAARVLLVDDNVDATQMLRETLREYGHELAVAHDGPTALELAASFQPDIAVLDIGLPVMSGYDLARKLREQRGAEKLRLIAVTGYGQETDRMRAREVGFDHHLIKPIALDALLDLLVK